MADTRAVAIIGLHDLNDEQWRNLCRIMSDDRVTRWLSNGAGWTREKLLKLREYSAHDVAIPHATREYFYWGITIGKDAQLVGIIGLHPSLPGAWARTFDVDARAPLQLMIAIDPVYWGRGIARAALDALITREFLAEIARTVQVIIREDNAASIAAFEKSGFVARDLRLPIFMCRRVPYRVYYVVEPRN